MTEVQTTELHSSFRTVFSRGIMARLFCFIRPDPVQYWGARSRNAGMLSVMWRNGAYNDVADGDQWKVLTECLPVRRQHVLDLGCGTGRLAERLASCFTEYTGVDIDGMISHARQRCPSLAERFVNCNANSYGFPSSTYDLVLSMACISAACSSTELPIILQRIAGSLAPGGRFIMIDPLHTYPLLARYLRMKPTQVVKLAEQSGLVLEEQRSIHCWPFRLFLARAAFASYPRLTAVSYRIGELVLRIAPKSLGDYALLVFKKVDAHTP